MPELEQAVSKVNDGPVRPSANDIRFERFIKADLFDFRFA